MKAEHKEFIDRAYLHGVSPMVLAHELMVHDLVEAALFELRNIKMPFTRLVKTTSRKLSIASPKRPAMWCVLR